jgi:hypothetical protein
LRRDFEDRSIAVSAVTVGGPVEISGCIHG